MLDLMDFLKGGGNHRIKLNREEYIRAFIACFIIFAVITIIAFEFKHFHNTFHVSSLVIKSLVFAILMGSTLSYFATKDQPKMELLTKFQLWVGIIILSMVVMPTMANLTNRLFSFRSVQEVPVEYVKSDPFFASRFGQMQDEQMTVSGYHIFVIRGDELKRLKTKEDIFDGVAKGAQVLLPIRRGFWGHDYVVLR